MTGPKRDQQAEPRLCDGLRLVDQHRAGVVEEAA